jgi:hypothetical protein
MSSSSFSLLLCDCLLVFSCLSLRDLVILSSTPSPFAHPDKRNVHTHSLSLTLTHITHVQQNNPPMARIIKQCEKQLGNTIEAYLILPVQVCVCMYVWCGVGVVRCGVVLCCVVVWCGGVVWCGVVCPCCLLYLLCVCVSKTCLSCSFLSSPLSPVLTAFVSVEICRLIYSFPFFCGVFSSVSFLPSFCSADTVFLASASHVMCFSYAQ